MKSIAHEKTIARRKPDITQQFTIYEHQSNKNNKKRTLILYHSRLRILMQIWVQMTAKTKQNDEIG
jgi:hypothetical protein